MIEALATPESLSAFGDPRLGLAVLALAGIAAGIINSFAGGGSFLTLPILTALGLPPSIANGTIRVGILSQNFAIVSTFWRGGIRPSLNTWLLALPMIVGASVGAWGATKLDDGVLLPLFGGVFVAWAVLLIVKPTSFAPHDEEVRAPNALTWVLAVVIGMYGGFMQAGVGFPLLAMLVGHLRMDPVAANALKALLVMSYTVIALVIFAGAGKVMWTAALVLAAATLIGGWWGTRLQLKYGGGMVRWVVLVMVLVSGCLMIYRAFG